MQFQTRSSHSPLHRFVRPLRGVARAKDGYFLRAESFFNAASYIEDVGVSGYGTRGLHDQSHGESFFTLFEHRFRGKGLYILDEPEAALSPSRQLSFLVRMHDLIADNSQFIIATHSPIILGYPDALIYQVSDQGLEAVAYEDTEHYQVTRAFLNRREAMLETLLSS
jgi:predicted ATPase